MGYHFQLGAADAYQIRRKIITKQAWKVIDYKTMEALLIRNVELLTSPKSPCPCKMFFTRFFLYCSNQKKDYNKHYFDNEHICQARQIGLASLGVCLAPPPCR